MSILVLGVCFWLSPSGGRRSRVRFFAQDKNIATREAGSVVINYISDLVPQVKRARTCTLARAHARSLLLFAAQRNTRTRMCTRFTTAHHARMRAKTLFLWRVDASFWLMMEDLCWRADDALCLSCDVWLLLNFANFARAPPVPLWLCGPPRLQQELH
eukprot:3939661-Rhodomonas_salina.1